jgi:hypothetical protein
MKIFITETDRQNARSVALRNLARFFGVDNWEIKNNKELLDDLSTLRERTATGIMKLLREYFDAYDNWFKFYEEKKKVEEKTGIEYDLTDTERKKLNGLIQKRENSLNALQQKFDELQQRFNQEKFGSKISGIIN